MCRFRLTGERLEVPGMPALELTDLLIGFSGTLGIDGTLLPSVGASLVAGAHFRSIGDAGELLSSAVVLRKKFERHRFAEPLAHSTYPPNAVRYLVAAWPRGSDG
jgi:hypothetical protein